MASRERDTTAGQGAAGDRSRSPDSQPGVPLGRSRPQSDTDLLAPPSGDPAPGPGEAPEMSLLPGQPQPPCSPSFASEWDEVISELWGGGGVMKYVALLLLWGLHGAR
ncbi:unnamed protein product [Lota lota]